MEGSAIFAGLGIKHQSFDALYADWFADMRDCGILNGPAHHTCIWSRTSSTPIEAAKRLAGAGLAILEDSPSGPMVTRTWRGSRALQEKLQQTP